MSGKIVAEDVPSILSRRASGESVHSIALDYAVTDMMVYHVLRGWVPRTRSEIEDLRWRKKEAARRGLKSQALRPAYEPQARHARSLLTKAIAKGVLVRQPCFCGATKVEGHHHNGYDDAHALDVVW